MCKCLKYDQRKQQIYSKNDKLGVKKYTHATISYKLYNFIEIRLRIRHSKKVIIITRGKSLATIYKIIDTMNENSPLFLTPHL